MKIYIVTSGCYSEYMIEKVFSNRAAAEEFKKWHNITNDIEEYEVFAEPLEKHEGEKAMFIRVQGTVYSEAVVDIKYVIRPALIREGGTTQHNGLVDYNKHSGSFTLYNEHFIPVANWDEEKYKAKFTKALYDLAGIIKAMFAEGASVADVSQTILERDD